MFYVYILESQKDNKYYIGFTADLIKRLKRHNNGIVKSTRSRRPFKLIYQEKYFSAQEAKKRENYLKKLKSHKYIKWLIEKNSGPVV